MSKSVSAATGVPVARFRNVFCVCGIAATLFFTSMVSSARAADSGSPEVNRLARNVERAELIRDVKHLQVAYAHFSQFGLWNEMAALFSDNAELIYGKDDVRGRSAIGSYFLKAFGNGHAGLPSGAIHTQMEITPVVILAPDGKSAIGRWHEISMLGRYGANADWAGGIMDNDYVKEGGVWKISRIHYYPVFAGPYETGWRNLDDDSKYVPYRFTPDQAGTPVPATDGVAPKTTASVASLERRADALNDEDKIMNLQNAYGYYVDRKMWDDVADLFSSDGMLEIADIGIYDGPKSIRRALDRDGPQGLLRGQVNDHVQFDTLVTVAPNGLEARARGLDWGMTGDTDNGQQAYWSVSVFENRYIKEGGTWKLREMRLFPVMKTSYYQGWAKSLIVDSKPGEGYAPDRPALAADSMRGDAVVPAFSYLNPVTRKKITYPKGSRVAGSSSPIGPHASAAVIAPSSGDMAARIAENERKIAVSVGYDAVENLNSAFGFWLDDNMLDKWASLWAAKGARENPSSGFFISPMRIFQAEIISRGVDKPPRVLIRTHLRYQPVIDVAPDGKSAKLRSRLLLFPTSRTTAGAVYSGMYEDQAVLENGVWKFWNVAIDDGFFRSSTYADGWARSKEPDPSVPRPVRGPSRLMTLYPPDVLTSSLGDRKLGQTGGTGTTVEWPGIKPMYFHYRNPVSGRTPTYYWPDCATCLVRPDTSLPRNMH